MTPGRVESIWITGTAGAPPVRVESVRVEPGRGLEGDRYAGKRGTYSTWPGTGREVTLIGEVRLRGVRRCEPCAYLAKLLGEPRLLKALVGRGGLRCDVVVAGTLRAGDRVG